METETRQDGRLKSGNDLIAVIACPLVSTRGAGSPVSPLHTNKVAWPLVDLVFAKALLHVPLAGGLMLLLPCSPVETSEFPTLLSTKDSL